MKPKSLLFLLALLGSANAIAGSATYCSDIAPIIYNHCTSCHRSGEIAPFPLTNYTEVSMWGGMIKYVTSIKYMPPWKPDKHYQQYQKENYLSDSEIAKIADWVDNGMPKGDPALEPPLPVFPTGSQIGTPDMVLSFAKSYTHIGNNEDEYRYFVLPTGLTTDKDLIALELRPGNKSIVHHTLVWQDTTGQAALDDAATTEYGYTSGSASTGLDNQLPGYVPGQKPQLFTNGIAYKLYAGSDLKLQMHYAPKTSDETDSTTINLFFASKPATRYLQSFVMVPIAGILTNPPFVMPANTIKTFHGQVTSPTDVSMVGVAPHMHKLGMDWKVYAVKPSGDTINLIKIDEWDFNWQGAYYFKKLTPLPAGSVIHAYASYDNTTGNINNPNSPPKLITWGEGTSDEMYYLPLIYLDYQPGDDTITFESTGIASQNYYQVQDKLYPVSPNPGSENINIGFTLATGTNLSLGLYNMLGQEVCEIVSKGYYLPGLHRLSYDVSKLASGNYTLLMNTGSGKYSQLISIKQE